MNRAFSVQTKFTEEEISKRLKKARPLSREQFFKQLKDDLRAAESASSGTASIVDPAPEKEKLYNRKS